MSEKLSSRTQKEKIQKKYGSFTDSVDGLNIADLEKTLMTYAKHREDTILAKKNDEELEATKDKLSELSGPYRDALSALKDKLAYINLLIKEKSGDAEETK
jgi:hypothetical protein